MSCRIPVSSAWKARMRSTGVSSLRGAFMGLS
jgi:hypothetical protein